MAAIKVVPQEEVILSLFPFGSRDFFVTGGRGYGTAGQAMAALTRTSVAALSM